MKKHSLMGVRALLLGFANAIAASRTEQTRFNPMQFFAPTSRRKPAKPKHRAAGNKVARLCYQGRATMCHPDGIIAATIREAAVRGRK